MPGRENRQEENSVMEEADVCTSFEDMGIKDQVLRGLYEHGFSKPSAIQQRAILPIIKGRDVIAQAQSGTGESSMIAIAVNEMIDSWSLDTQVLILSPTRELALQTEKAIRSIGDFINIRVHACVGGNSLGYDISKLQNGVQVVSGTPGRVYDMLKRGELDTSSVRCLILDESDEMLRRGFKVKINHIYRYLPLEVQVVLISATLPTEILEMTEKFMTDPVSILVERDQLTSMESTELPRQAT